MSLYIQTPTVVSTLGRTAQRSVFLKLEALQPMGSFKLRGVSKFCEVKRNEGAKRFVSSSGGNAGLAVAYTGAAHGVPVAVYVPETTSAQAIAQIRAAGGSVTVVGANWAEANAYALNNLVDGDAFVHPFDDPLLWDGHATLVDELVHQVSKPDVVICAVGGGGLLCGVVEGLGRNGWADVPVVAVETRGAASYAAALIAGQPVDLGSLSTVATSLGAPSVCARAVSYGALHPIESLVVEDRDAIRGSLALLDGHRLVTEPACGAAIAALSADSRLVEHATSVVVVVCGGVGTTARQLLAWSNELEDNNSPR